MASSDQITDDWIAVIDSLCVCFQEKRIVGTPHVSPQVL